MTTQINSLMLVGTVNADDTLFRAACEYAWLTDWTEHVIVTVETVIVNMEHRPTSTFDQQLWNICMEANGRGIAELIFTFHGETPDEEH